MATHDLKYPDVIEMLLHCQTDAERQECFDSIVNRVAAKDNMSAKECRGNLLKSLHYVAGYYDDDMCKQVRQILGKFQEDSNAN